MDEKWIASFREKIDQFYAWPSLYTFKFIVPLGKEAEVARLFPKHEVTYKPSKNGNYVSVTAQVMMPSADSVIAIYQSAAAIEGIVAL